MKYKHIICTEAREDIFEKQCLALENHIPQLRKKKLITDVDGAKIQKYEYSGKPIEVRLDMQIGTVYIQSEVDLDPFFEKAV